MVPQMSVDGPTDVCPFAAQGRSSYRHVQISVRMQLQVDRPTESCTYAALGLGLTVICTDICGTIDLELHRHLWDHRLRASSHGYLYK